MVNLGFLRKKTGAAVILLVIVVVSGFVLWHLLFKPAQPSLKDMGVTLSAAPEIALYPVVEGWQPEGPKDSEGFSSVAENSGFSLWLKAETGEIAVIDKGSGYRWRSNPPAEELAEETVKGTLLTNLSSIFTMEYYENSRTQRLLTNSLHPELDTRYNPGKNSVQATYTFKDLGIQFSIQFVLTPSGLEVNIPAGGIKEQGSFSLISIGMLPFFGSSRNTDGKDDYLFVPDGPGALIRFKSDRNLVGSGYHYPIYGYDVANLPGDVFYERREVIAYPVFGLKQGSNAFLSIIKQGEYTASIRALPAGMASSYNSISAQFVYREEYGQRLSKRGAPVNTFQRTLLKQDRSMEYRLLSGEDADYVGMAKAYRSYLTESGQLVRKAGKAEHLALDLSIMGGDIRKISTGHQYQSLTTFEQAQEMIDELNRSGIGDMRITYYGWQQGGNSETGNRYPIRKELGGKSGAEAFVRKAHDYGYEVLFKDNLSAVDTTISDLTPKTDGIRSVDGTVLFDWDYIYLNPVLALSQNGRSLQRLDELGIDGIHYSEMGSYLFSDYNPKGTFKRDQTAELYQAMLSMTRERLGQTSIEHGNAYLLPVADFVQGLPMDTSQDIIVDEAVPFYPIVLHGSIPYSGAVGNLRNQYEEEMLRSIEYGAMPAFFLSNDTSRKLKGTWSDNLYSSEFRIWKDRLVVEYKKFNQLAPLYGQLIVDHGKKGEGIYFTTYEDGTQVIVDYNTKAFEVVKGVQHE